MAAPIVKLNPVQVAENYCSDGNNRWKAHTLFEAAKGLEQFEVPVAALPVNRMCWSNGAKTPLRLAEEMTRTLAADLDHPIILGDDGVILDGMHRLAKALYEGRSTILAVRLEKNPEPDWTEKDGGAE